MNPLFGLLACGFGAAAFAGPTAADGPWPLPMDLAAAPQEAHFRPDNPDGTAHEVQGRLIVDKTAAVPGDTIRVGVHIHQAPGWHTYWKSPGSIGLPTEIEWILPEGWTAEPFQFPVPLRFVQDPDISYGYDGEVVLFSNISVPADAVPGDVSVGAEISWLVCKTSCKPGSGSATHLITVGATAEPTANSALLDAWAARHPAALDDIDAIKVDFEVMGGAVPPDSPFQARWTITGADGQALAAPGEEPWPTIAPIAPDLADWMIEGAKVEQGPDGAIIATVDAISFFVDNAPTNDTIGALLQVQTADGTWIRTEHTWPLPWAASVAVAEVEPEPAAVPTATDGDPVAIAEFEVDKAEPVWFITYLGLALFGGLILNVMPCVLPVLTLKLYSLIEQTDISAKDKQISGVSYTGGIVVSFWALAGAILVLRWWFGIQASWGFQMQYPPYVAGLATVVFLFGLSLFGVFEIPALGAAQADEISDKEGPAGYFLTGVFATLLATPCSAPFLGTATAFALQAPAAELFAIFTAIGLGLASPFLLIAFFPTLYKLMPQPGEWMEWFKELLGFTLVATAVWLTGVLMAEVGPDRTVDYLWFLAICSMAAWAYGRWGGLGETRARQGAVFGAALLLSTGAGYQLLDLEYAQAAECDDGAVVETLDFSHEIPWQPFSEKRVANLAGQPMFIDFTADWCVTCKFNERTILETDAVRNAMSAMNIIPLQADFTRMDPVIQAWLDRYKKAGVPFYLVLAADGTPTALPEVITQEMVIEAMRQATSG